MQGHSLTFLREQLALQKDQLFLWSPVFVSIGIGTYFSLPFEPILGYTLTIFILCSLGLVAAIPIRKSNFRNAYLLIVALNLIILGFLCACVRTQLVNSPIIQNDIKVAEVIGTIEGIEPLEEGKGSRIIIYKPQINKLWPVQTPKRLRLKLKQDDNIRIGQKIKVLASLSPPSEPLIPDGFDFRRHLYFQGIGGVGFIFKNPEIIEQNNVSTNIENIRDAAKRRIESILPPRESAVAIALMIGQQNALSKNDMDAIRNSGLAHMLSISGLHITLMAGVLFFLSRLCLVLIPNFGVLYPAKKFAAVFAMLGAVFYMLLAGSTAPTVRSVLMIGMAFLAIILDRSPISLRLVAFSALVILIFQPENLISVSFQMSFAAVTALIAFFDQTRNFWSRANEKFNLAGRILIYITSVCVTTIIATIASTPFSIFHFQQFAFMGVIANLVAVPLLSFFIMPFIVLSFFLMPVGLDIFPLKIVGIGIEMILQIAHSASNLPHAVISFAAIPFSALLCCILCGLWIILWKGIGKFCGLILLIPAAFIIAAAQSPDILISENHKLVGVITTDSKLYVNNRMSEKFVRTGWKKSLGLNDDLVLQEEGEIPTLNGRCDPEACRFMIKGQNVSILRSPYVQKQECNWADIILSPDPINTSCNSKYVIDIFDTKMRGVHAVFISSSDDSIRIRSVRDSIGNRPWTNSMAPYSKMYDARLRAPPPQ